MFLLIVFLPLLSAFLCGFFGFFLGNRGSALCSVGLIFITFLISSYLFFSVGFNVYPYYYNLFSWVSSGVFQLNWGFIFDSLSVTILFVVSLISFFVHIYSVEYMRTDAHFSRFISYLSLFTFFIILLVSADNLVFMFVGWEGVGLCSYLLINFWFTRIQANKAAIKAILVNRVGDLGLAFGILLVFFQFNAVDYATIFSISGKILPVKVFDISLLEVGGFFIFVGAIGKSAQLGLHTWLPDAIEGPTPVSALIHAATIVTAGVFMLLRCSPLFEFCPIILSFITVFGALTAFFASTVGLVQNDLKKVIAYSTCSQLGYIMFACGLSNYSVSVFHLVNHAFFKALLFLSAGSVIHAISDEQDIRKIGGLAKILPFTYSVILLGSFALIGFPFLSGFYSKDAILEVAFSTFTVHGHFSFWLGTFAASCTAFYSIRLLILTFLSKPKSYKFIAINLHESSQFFIIPLGILAVFSCVHGYLARDFYIGIGSFFWGNSLYQNPQNQVLLDAEFLPPSIKLLPLFFSFSGIFFGYIFYLLIIEKVITFKLSKYGRMCYFFFNKKWLFDRIYFEKINQRVISIGYYTTYQQVDRGILEIFGPLGISTFFHQQGNMFSRYQSGHINHYLLNLYFFIIVILYIITHLIFFFEFPLDFRMYWLIFFSIFFILFELVGV